MGRPKGRPVQAALCAGGLATLAIPPLVVGLSGTAAADALWTVLRLAALLAFTLVFLSIVSGTFRPWLNRIFRARAVQRLHQTTGVAGLSLAAAHGLLALVFGITGYAPAALWLGPGALVLLTVAVLAALLRRGLRRSWRWMHRLNYVVFAAVLAHGLVLGFDLRSQLLLRVIFVVYAAIAAAGLVYRLHSRRPQPGVRQ